ncbi:alpha/beta fold hydrolase [Chryseosolibacter indicus]|uniref:Alpha/beta hydrolase n=1 Tax=Chryseosolibacter indicus TaxID=2782351 RepID=A0ABS5VV67_9BACT|nr:alpha/beta hydrolase [Chryseosolibacter indicus]MBT1705332.1 alpha/beta hydrolase [Chryseosolibacter indicus]
MISNHYLNYQSSRIHYVKAGNGKETLLFFHGFGQDHTVYIPLIQSLAKHYSLYIFDLFFHGQSKWGYDERPLEKKYWKEMIAQFLKENSITSFSVVGYSLGGRFALSTLEAFPEKINKVFLIASDGIRENTWYKLATYPFFLRKFFKSMIHNYNRFLTIADKLVKWKLVDPGLIRFADYQMGTTEKRKRVYYSWVVFRHMKFNIRRLASLINKHNIQTVVIVGRYDKVILPEHMDKFRSLLNNHKFHALESGHSGLIYQSLPFIAEKVSPSNYIIR